MEPNDEEGYPAGPVAPQRFHHPQANGTVPRPSSHIRQQQMMDIPPPAYNEHPTPPMGNGSVGGGGPSLSRDLSGDGFPPSAVVAAPPSRSAHPRDRGDFGSTSSSSHTTTREYKRSSSLELVQPKILKVAVIGDSTVGKTCICQAVTQERYNFNKNYQLTCGVVVYAKGIKLPEEKDEQVNMVLMDSSGKDIYTESLPKYWGKLDGVVLVLDVSSSSSIQNAGQWLSLAQKCIKVSGSSRDATRKMTGVLMANKLDVPVERRVVSSRDALQFAVNNNLKYFECSVKDNSGLEEPFHCLAKLWLSGSLGLNSGGASHNNQSHNDDKENNADDY